MAARVFFDGLPGENFGGDSGSDAGNAVPLGQPGNASGQGFVDPPAPTPQDTGAGTISLTTAGAAVTQNFDTLSNTAGSTTNTTLPSGWYITETGGGARDNEQYAVDTGGSTTGDTFSYGAAAATDRALGSLRSGTLIPVYGAMFTNNTGGAIGSLAIAYTGEEWRLGTAARADRLDFQISFDATSLTTGTWIDIDQLDFSTPDTVTTGAKNGNAAADQTAISYTYALANALANGATFWIRWNDSDATGADDGLAIDNFSLTPIAAVAAPGNLAINDVSHSEGNAGTTDYAFTVTRSGGTAGAVTADYTVNFGTADVADFSGLLSGTVSFADGESSKVIHVSVAGDSAVESTETFTVDLTNPTGGVTITDAQGLGTIVNDDTPPVGSLAINDVTLAEGNSGSTDFVFTVTRSGGSAGAVTVDYAIGLGTADAADFTTYPLTGTVSFADGETSKQIHVAIAGDTAVEASDTFTVALSNPTGGVTITDASGAGTITNDDFPPAANVFINEIHYDNSSTDVGEAIEIAGTAGTDLTGYKLVLYNGTTLPNAAPVYNTLNLSGTIDNESNGYGAISFAYAVNGIQNGPADGIALIAPDGSVIQFLSYGGAITAAAGTPAAGLTSTDIGVAESPAPGVGFSLQLTGTGSTYGDFTWQNPADDSFGTVNVGQSFLPATGTSHIRIDDTSLVEGNSGTTNMVFTVHRAGGQSAPASVDYTVTLDANADSADLGVAAVLSGTVSFGVGEFTKTIVIPIQGDTVGERNETFHVTLGATTGDAVVDRATATGTITNDDPLPLVIGEIQGEGHTSAYVGQTVITNGIVTAVDSNGFYLQDATGDGNSRTSDGIFVFTSTAPTVVVGDAVQATGIVAEFLGDAASLTVTQLNLSAVAIGTHGNALPAAILIGEHGVLPPTDWIDNDGLTSYDPTSDGIDFWESMEGMRVTIETPMAVSNTTSFGETDVVASLGVGATGVNDRGGITISPNGAGQPADFNPEKIQIDDDSGIFAGFSPNYTIGDQLSSVTGILNYGFGNYEVLVTEAVTLTFDQTLTKEQTALTGDAKHLTLATYNLENLDTSDNKFDILATNIVYNLRAPDIVAVQEIQDTDGAGSGSDLSGTITAQGLIDSIFALYGLHYAYIEIAPTVAGTTGGEPGGNIRNGYLYNVDRVSPVAGSAELITGSAYNGSRNPLVVTWNFHDQQITTINVHSTSRGGSDGLWGNTQPPSDAGDAARTAQAAGVKAYINAHLADNPNLNIAVLGDWNGFYFEAAQTQLTDPVQGGVLTNLNTLLPEQERYSYLFDGNAQQIDNILVTHNLLNLAQYDAVHINSQFAAAGRPTDHDPQITVLNFDIAAVAVNDSNTVAANAAITGASVIGNDSDADDASVTVAAVNGSGTDVGNQITLASGALLTLRADGSYDYDPNHAFDGLTAATGAANSTGTDSFSYTLANGGTATVTITVGANAASTAPANGTASDDIITGTSANNGFRLQQGGHDTVSGGQGDDGFYVGDAWDAQDVLDGGAGTLDQVGIQGDYSAGLTLGANSLTGVEMLVFLPGNDTRFGDISESTYSYDITTDDANVAAGELLIVQANTLRSGENLTFDGSAESDGRFRFYGGFGNDHLTGGQQSDGFYFGDGRFGAGDVVDGQGGSLDQLALQGDFSGANALTFGASQISGIEMIVLLSGADTRFGGGGLAFSYVLTMDDGNVSAGSLITVQGNALRANETLIVDASAETDASYRVYGGAGDDSITGGALADQLWGNAGADVLTGKGGADQLHGGAGSDIFVYQLVSDSTAAARDHIFDFTSGDKIDVAAVGLSSVSTSGFHNIAGELAASYTGSSWLIEGDTDGNGIADLSIEVDAASNYNWTTADFLLGPSAASTTVPLGAKGSLGMLVDSMAIVSIDDLMNGLSYGTDAAELHGNLALRPFAMQILGEHTL